MPARMSKRAVAAAQPGDRDTFLWDTEVKGFGLKVTPAGGKVYVLQYRQGGRGAATRRQKIGRHRPPWTPDSARAEALRLLRLIEQGAGPASPPPSRPP